jgi:hypothetical protein
VIASQLAQYDFLDWLFDYEHTAGRLVMGNLFPTGYRYYAHLFDFAGSEVSDTRENEALAALRRTLMHRKLNTNLLQWWRGEEFVTHDQMRDYIEGQMFWGFFPGVASCGGGIDWGETIERYFLHPEIYERDRPLFRQYIPIIRELSRAGWEPVTHASASPGIRVERFGSWTERSLHFTLCNDNETTATARIAVEAPALGIVRNLAFGIAARERVTDQSLPIDWTGDDRTLRTAVELGPQRVKIVRFQQEPLGARLWIHY